MNSTASFNVTESLLANITGTPSPAPFPSLPSPVLPAPLPTILVVLCLFLLFAGCTTFLALCRPSARSGGDSEGGGCGPGDPLPCGSALSSEPQLRLWKRLGSARRSFTSSFRRPPPPPRRRTDRDGSSSSSSPGPLPPHLTVPCLFDHATEI